MPAAARRRSFWPFLLGPFLVAGCASVPSIAPGTLAPFSTDGCSLFPDRSLIDKVDWCRCCVAHDLAYWRGGTSENRLAADRDLRACVHQATGNEALAELMFAGVRAGGGPYFFTPYRWAYGWSYGRNYEPLSASEEVQANALEREYRDKNPTLACPSSESTAELRANPSVEARPHLIR